VSLRGEERPPPTRRHRLDLESRTSSASQVPSNLERRTPLPLRRRAARRRHGPGQAASRTTRGRGRRRRDREGLRALHCFDRAFGDRGGAGSVSRSRVDRRAARRHYPRGAGRRPVPDDRRAARESRSTAGRPRCRGVPDGAGIESSPSRS
jgi:hypothetical protein